MDAASVQFGQYPPARRTILHVSDTHLLAGNPRLAGRYDTAANLARTLEALERVAVQPDAIVFTGDLTDLGEPEAYTALRAAVEPVAERLGAPVVWVAGNHDGYNNVDLAPGKTFKMWAKFPAPPEATEKVTLYLEGVPPFEDVPLAK